MHLAHSTHLTRFPLSSYPLSDAEDLQIMDRSKYLPVRRPSLPSRTPPSPPLILETPEDAPSEGITPAPSSTSLAPHPSQSAPAHLTASHHFQSFEQLMGGAVHVSVSRSSVVFDGAHTHVQAEEHHLREGQWQQERLEGVWEGDRSQEMIARLSRRPHSSSLSGSRAPRATLTPPRARSRRR